MAPDCPFCAIAAGRAPAGMVHEDEQCLAFMNLRPIHEGELLVIPRIHVDQFIDLPNPLAAHIIAIAQELARRIRSEFRPNRVGYLVSGYGVAHAHLCVVPLHDEHDLVSARHLQIVDGAPIFSDAHLERTMAELELAAKRLRG